jgi:hypothetical protein
MDPVAAAGTLAAAAAGGGAAMATADLEDDDVLVCEILELQMDMDCKKIDHSCLIIFSDNIMRELPCQSREGGAAKLGKVLAMLKMNNTMATSESAAPECRIGTKLALVTFPQSWSALLRLRQSGPELLHMMAASTHGLQTQVQQTTKRTA